MDTLKWIAGNDALDSSLYQSKAVFVGHMFRAYGGIRCVLFEASNKRALVEQNHGQFITDREFWKRIFDLVCDDDFFISALQIMANGEFDPENEKDYTVLVYVGVLRRFYNEVLPKLEFKNVDHNKVSQIDFALTKIAFKAGINAGHIGLTVFEHDKTTLRLQNSAKSISKKKSFRKQKAIELFHTISGNRSDLKPYVAADKILSKWLPKEDAPDKGTIVRYLREENLIK